VSRSRYGRYTGLLGLVVLLALILHSILVSPVDPTGVPPGQRLAPFAVPLALGSLSGDADIAVHADEGSNGRVPACAERGAQILNVCQLYEQGPVVLALFVDSGSCTKVLDQMQSLAPVFPGVRFAAVAIRGERGQLRELVHARGLTLPLGVDSDGAVAALYKVFSCPQVNFAYPGGVVQSKALLGESTLATLRARVSELVAASRARAHPEPPA
jgi:peroxiredoxin